MMPKPKQGICFDLDGTLIDSGPGGLVQLFEVVKSLNLPMNEEIEARIRAMWGRHPSNLIKGAWPDTDINRFFKKWEDLEIAKPWPVFPGVKEALKKLFKNFYLSILTNRNFKTTMAQLDHNDLLQFFGLVIAGDSSPYKKPDPRSMKTIFQYSKGVGVNPRHIIFVGDTVEADWKIAQAVGIEFYAVTCGGMDTREKFLKAGVPENHIINSVTDLPEILLN